MYVWLRESKLDETKGDKEKWTYSGPYIIHQKRGQGSFILRELSGAILKGHVNIRRLRLFYFRPDNQTLRTKTPLTDTSSTMDTSNSHLRLDVALASLGLSAEFLPSSSPPFDPLFCVRVRSAE
jgi:hypothetical protein